MIIALGLTGFSFQLLKVLADAMVGGASPDAVRGRVFSLYDVLYNVAFVLAGLLMIPLWKPARDHVLLGALAVAFLAGGAVLFGCSATERLGNGRLTRHRRRSLDRLGSHHGCSRSGLITRIVAFWHRPGPT